MAALTKVRCGGCRKQSEIVTPPKDEVPVLWECPQCGDRNTFADKANG